MADGVGFEEGGAAVGEGEGGGEVDWGVGDGGGGVVAEIEVAGEVRGLDGELGAEVDLGGGEVEGGGLGVGGEEDVERGRWSSWFGRRRWLWG